MFKQNYKRWTTHIQPAHAIILLALLAMLALPLLFTVLTSDGYYGRLLNQPAPNFQLKDTQDQPHTLTQHKGRFVLLYYGYINCDDVCHNQVGVMYNTFHQSPYKNLDVIFITMDPKRDTPTLLRQYFNHFGPNFYALTAKTMADVQKIASKYRAYFAPDQSTNAGKDYEIEHAGSIFLIPPQQDKMLIYSGQYLRYDKIIEDISNLSQKNRTTSN